MEIKVLGTGCQKCKKLYNLVQEVLTENNLQANVEKVEEITQIVQYGVMITPALVVDGTVKVTGKVPSKDEIKKLLGE
jgi:small redox-active disulfide protein 2